jgi:hypothetical protein
MCSQDYGKLHSLDIPNPSNETICKIPIIMSSSERWICHAIYPSFFSIFLLGDFGCYLVLVDNYGELYYFRAERHYSEIWVVDTIKDKLLKQQFICTPQEEKPFAFTNNFIDILKSSYIPFDSARYKINRSDKPTIGIEKYIETLLGKNKDLITEYNAMLSYEPPETPFKSPKDYYEGLLDQTNAILVIKYQPEESFKNTELKIYCSWNNWLIGYDVNHYKDNDTDEEFLYINLFEEDLDEVEQGKYHYKFKNGDLWIEPTESDLKEQKDGIWNNVLFIHESSKELDWDI